MCILCKNERNFPKRDRWIITQPIVRETLDIMSCIKRANSVRVETKEDYIYRRGQQVEAYAHTEALLTLMDIAYLSLGLESKRVEYWTGLVLSVQNLLHNWRKSDKEKYKTLFEEDAAG